MKISISKKDENERFGAICESVHRGGLPSDPMEIAKILGIADEFAAMGEPVRGKRRRRRSNRDDDYEEEALGI